MDVSTFIVETPFSHNVPYLFKVGQPFVNRAAEWGRWPGRDMIGERRSLSIINPHIERGQRRDKRSKPADLLDGAGGTKLLHDRTVIDRHTFGIGDPRHIDDAVKICAVVKLLTEPAPGLLRASAHGIGWHTQTAGAAGRSSRVSGASASRLAATSSSISSRSRTRFVRPWKRSRMTFSASAVDRSCAA